MKLVWNQKLGPADCPYLIRWVLDLGMFSIRLHNWIRSDDLRHPHDHPWSFWSFVLKGYIIERSKEGEFKRQRFSLNYFNAEYSHSVIVEKSAWTLLLTGPEKRRWGYWVDGKFRKRNKYYFEHGHHDPCTQEI